MKQELDRVKNDLETMQKAMGLPTAMKREWIHWMKRDGWSCLWWFVPGFIVMATAFFPPAEHAHRYWGLQPGQWAGVLATIAMLWLAWVADRQMKGKDGRPEEMVRKLTRVNVNGMTVQGLWVGLAFLAQWALYFIWGIQHHIGSEAFWAGLILLPGTTFLMAALALKAWAWLGVAIPFLAYGLCLPLAKGHHKVELLMFGMMFFAIGLSSSMIQAWQIRKVQRQNESH